MINPNSHLGPTPPASRPSRVVGGSSSLPPVAPAKVETDRVELGATEASEVQKLAAPKDPSADERPRHVEGEILVKTASTLFKSDQPGLLESLGATVAERFEFPEELFKSFDGEVLRLKLPEGTTTEQALEMLADDPRVASVVPNEILYLDEVSEQGATGASGDTLKSLGGEGRLPNDLDPKLWGLHNEGQDGGLADADIDAPEAWAKTVGSKDTVIAVLDTGVDYNHPDLKDNIWRNPNESFNGKDDDGNGIVDDVYGYNAFDDTGDPMDRHSHGTHVAGTIAARGDNGEGITGVSWKAKIMPIKIFDDNGRTTSDAILRGLLYATKNGAQVTNNSWGGPNANPLIQEAFEKASGFHVMAAGNDGADNDRRPFYPNNYDLGENSIRVAASDRNDRLARFSNHGPGSVDLAAPGVQIYSTMPGGGYAYKSGTSMAAPHVAGAAGLLLAQNPEMSNKELRERLMNGAERKETLIGKVATNARLNVNNSLADDAVAPAEIGDLSGRSPAPHRLELQFTAPGDDGTQGRASAYEVRVSEQPIETLEQYLQAPLMRIMEPQEAGQQELLELSIPPETRERTLHVAVQAFDKVNNASGVASVQVAVPAAQVAFGQELSSRADSWQMEGSWGTEEIDGKTVFSDSPGANYPSRADHSITSPVIDLGRFDGSTLTFEAEHQLEEGYDVVHLEVAQAGSEEPQWTGLHAFTGPGLEQAHSFDLSPYDGQQIQVRFRLESDQSYEEDGFRFHSLQVLGQEKA